jgi:hypothetical protein
VAGGKQAERGIRIKRIPRAIVERDDIAGGADAMLRECRRCGSANRLLVEAEVVAVSVRNETMRARNPTIKI